MKKIILSLSIIGIIATSGLAYIATRQGNEEIFTSKDVIENSKNVSQKTTAASEVSEPHPSDETGWSAFRKTTNEPEVNPDVTAEISVGRSATKPKTITAKLGQRVKLTFTSAINDQVTIDDYTANTYIMPLGEFSTSFNADKKGKFTINLVNTKRAIGYLEVN